MLIKSRMSSILGKIESKHPELFALEFGKIAESDFVYTLASANIDQSVPNLATIYMPIKSQMSLILEQIELEHPELFALEFGKIAESDFVYTLASTNIEKINTKLGQNVRDHKTLDEFNYGSNQTRTVGVICP